jgi:hypothetical protein
MSGIKHTPGPWTVEDLGKEQLVVRSAFSNIATMDGASPHGTHYLRQDARLIAAAPNLLKACELAKSLYWQMVEHLPPAMLPEMGPLWDALTQAIAEAKETPPLQEEEK